MNELGVESAFDGAAPHAEDTLVQKLFRLHDEIRKDAKFEALNRIAVAVYDNKTDLLKTFIHSTGGGRSPLCFYQAKLADSPSLLALAQSGECRVINDLALVHADKPHAQQVAAFGFKSSYTVPIRHNGAFRGFLFFNATEQDFFTPAIVHGLWPYAQIASFLAVMEFESIRMMHAAVRTVRKISHQRDEETGGHLDRMARYARLIAVNVAEKHGLSEEFVEFLFQFAPLHDVGKVGVPDQILLKPARLTDAEYEVMKAHVAKGRAIIDTMVRDFSLETVDHIAILHNVVAYHHEAWDGSGYPYRLTGTQIPIEARICAVADVFDALTSSRPYKSAWSNADALAHLQEQAGHKFDPDCVAALAAHMAEVEIIQRQFAETVFD